MYSVKSFTIEYIKSPTGVGDVRITFCTETARSDRSDVYKITVLYFVINLSKTHFKRDLIWIKPKNSRNIKYIKYA